MIKNDTQFDDMNDMKEFAAEISAVKSLHDIRPTEVLNARILSSLENLPAQPVTDANVARSIMKGRSEATFSSFLGSLTAWRVMVPVGVVAALALLVVGMNRPGTGPQTDAFRTASNEAAGTVTPEGDTIQSQAFGVKQASPMAAGATGAASTVVADTSIEAIIANMMDNELADASITADEDDNVQSGLSDTQTFTDFSETFDQTTL